MNGSKKNSVLVVDDETSNIIALTNILGRQYTIYASTDGREAIETAETFVPDVILLDILMPEMDGYAVIAELKKSVKTRDIPVIFITGLDISKAEEKGLELGAVDYLRKPFQSAIVRLRVQNQIKLIERTRQQAFMAKISHSFLSNAYVDTLYTDTLRMAGEFMNIAQVLLYRFEDDDNIIFCQNEWIKPELNLGTRLGEKIELNEPVISIVKSFMSKNETDICLHSNNMVFNEAMRPYRKNFNNYILTPVFVKGKIMAALDFSKEDDGRSWSENEINLAILLSGIFSGAFERSAMERQFFIVEHSPNLALYFTADTAVEYVNPAASAITGYTKNEFLAGGIGIIFDEKTLNEIKEQHIPNALRGETVLFEVWITRKDGQKRVLMIYIIQTGKNDLGMIASDLTEKRELENNLIAAKELAEQSSLAKTVFLSQMSHEIRTPMNAILGIAEILLRNKNLSPDTEEALGKIYEAGDLLLNIINDILDLSKIESGKLALVPAKYDIPSLINDTAQLNRLRYDSKPIDFLIHVDENTPIDLFGDELRIKQILNNILSNAFKYTDIGKIEFSISAEPGEADNITLIFRVSDTGQGMTESQLERLFEEYARFNLDVNRTIAGAGLGMPITERLLNLMNGNIEVESAPGKGSVFTVRIPQKRTSPAVCGQEMSEKLRSFHFQSPANKRKTQFIPEYMPYGSILVVDDVESNIYVIKGMLAPYGLKIETSSSGFEAIKNIKNGSTYDIIFMDHMMPKMDGIEATKILRDMGYTNTIVALTANALVGRAEMFMQNGFDGFISKPIDTRELNRMLNELIRNKKPQEVIEAARQKSQAEGLPQPAAINEGLAAATANDIENALTVLEELLPKSDADIRLFATTVHGMKSALANAGETALSNIALRLEQAANNGETSVISTETPEFIKALRSLLEKIKAAIEGETGENVNISQEDVNFLRNKLTDIKTACEKLVLKDAKKAVAELKQKTWPRKTGDIINEISLCLLRGEFAKVVSAADETLNTLG